MNDLEVINLADPMPPAPVLARYCPETEQLLLKATPYWWYPIDVSRCNSESKIIAWIIHLSPKRWVTGQHIVQFIDAAAGAADLRIRRSL